jgi:hypothetical protein
MRVLFVVELWGWADPDYERVWDEARFDMDFGYVGWNLGRNWSDCCLVDHTLRIVRDDGEWSKEYGEKVQTDERWQSANWVLIVNDGCVDGKRG